MKSNTDIIAVVGSSSADFFISIDRLPAIGETMGSQITEVKFGGKVFILLFRVVIKQLHAPYLGQIHTLLSNWEQILMQI